MRTWSILAALLVCSANVHASSPLFDETGPSEWAKVLICITAGDEPWKEIDQGTLRTWHQGDVVAHRLVAGGSATSWVLVRRPDGVRQYGDFSLIHYITRYVDVPSKYRFGPDQMPGTRLGYDIEPQSSSINDRGEITQRFGPFTIASVRGDKCPGKEHAD
jgi:hypothetical protein